MFFFLFQNLSPWLLERLGLIESEEHLVPCHTHLFRRHFPNYFRKGKDLTVFAPPPNHFRATLDTLQIKFDLKQIMNDDVVRTYPKQKSELKKVQEKETIRRLKVPKTHAGDKWVMLSSRLIILAVMKVTLPSLGMFLESHFLSGFSRETMLLFKSSQKSVSNNMFQVAVKTHSHRLCVWQKQYLSYRYCVLLHL